jgi:hypothetical protein
LYDWRATKFFCNTKPSFRANTFPVTASLFDPGGGFRQYLISKFPGLQRRKWSREKFVDEARTVGHRGSFTLHLHDAQGKENRTWSKSKFNRELVHALFRHSGWSFICGLPDRTSLINLGRQSHCYSHPSKP